MDSSVPSGAWTRGEGIILRRATSYAIRAALGALAFLLVFIPVSLGVLVWQVRQGPIAISPILPTLSEIVRERSGASFAASGAFLAWDDTRNRIVFRLTQVEIGTGQGTSTRLPVVDAEYRLRGLLRGLLLPTAITIHRPRLVLARSESGLRIGVDETEAPPTPEIGDKAGFDLKAALGPLMAPGDEHLDSISVIDASATIVDIPRGRHYSVPRLDARTERTPDGLIAQVDFAARLGGVTAYFALGAEYDEAAGQVEATLDFQEVVPSLFAAEFEALADAAAVSLPLSGRITARMHPRDVADIGIADLRRAEVRARILGGQGVIVAPDPVGLTYPVRGFRLEGEYDGARARGSLDTLLIDMPDATVSLEAQASWPADAPADGDTIPPAEGNPGVTVVAVARLTDTALDSFERYWPPGMVDDARAWVVQNLRDGQVEEARFAVELTGATWDEIDVSRFGGEARVKGASVHYLRPMPPITDINGEVIFGLRTVEVLPDTGHVGNLVIQPGGTVRISGLADDIQWTEISADIVGPVREALRLVDSEPLKLLSAIGTVDPEQISGHGVTHLEMRFPLLNDLKLVDMTVKATSRVTDGVVKDAIPGRTLTEGVLDLAVDLDQLDIKGQGKVNGVPMTLGWNEKFSGPGVRTRYAIAGTVDGPGRKALGLDFMPFEAPYITGPMVADAVATVDAKGRMTLEAKLDLTPATITAPGLGWSKPPGTDASGAATIQFVKGTLQGISQFRMRSANGLNVTGSAEARADGSLRSVALSQLTIGENVAQGGLSLAQDGTVDATFEAGFFNLQPLVRDGGWRELTDDDAPPDATPPAAASGAKPPPEPATPMTLNLSARRARISEDGAMTDLTATLHRGADGKWVGTVNGNLPEGRTVIVVQRSGADARALEIASANAGALLTAAGVTTSLRRGTMALNAVIPDEGAISGKVRIENFSVTETPLLAQLISVASITGIADVLANQGVSFWYLDSPFSLNDGALTLAETRAAGPSFGITAVGTVNTETDGVALRGTIVPFNLVNQVISNIPLIGQILGGKDSGLFAMSYTIKGTLDKPDVAVNPLSALVPGGVKKLFFPDDKVPVPIDPAPVR